MRGNYTCTPTDVEMWRCEDTETRTLEITMLQELHSG